MSRLTPADMAVDDIVLLDMRLTRYKESKAAIDWSSYMTSFSLEGVTLLGEYPQGWTIDGQYLDLSNVASGSVAF